MVRKIFLTIIGVVVLSTVGLENICSQDILDPFAKPAEDEVVLVVGEVSVFSVNSPKRVSIRNPDIAQISKVAENEVIVVGQSAGETTLTVWDKDGKRTYYITVYAQDLARVKKRAQKLIYKDLKIKGVQIRINESTGKLILMGQVSVQEKEQIDKVIEPFVDYVDNLLVTKKESKMVQIEARILELNKSDLDRLGVDWMDSLQIRQEPYSADTSANVAASSGVQTTLDKQAKWTSIWGMGSWSRDAIHAKINLLIRDGKGRELSRPKLLCLSGEEAKLTVGGEVPYLSGSTEGSAGTSLNVEYREYGVILTVRPVVLTGSKIFTTLKAEVSDLDWTNNLQVSGVNVPAFTTREAETVLNLRTGDTVFIAGLIKEKDSETVEKFPFLSKVPILGALFRSKEFQNNETELVISLTPKVIDTEEETIQLPKRAEVPAEYRSKLNLYASMIPINLQEYVAGVQRKILSNVMYPSSLINTGWQGKVVLKLTVGEMGELKRVRVVHPSGYHAFDEEAVNLVENLSFSPFPPEVELEELEIEVPIVYQE